jgi:hypothetical protein
LLFTKLASLEWVYLLFDLFLILDRLIGIKSLCYSFQFICVPPLFLFMLEMGGRYGQRGMGGMVIERGRAAWSMVWSMVYSKR